MTLQRQRFGQLPGASLLLYGYLLLQGSMSSSAKSVERTRQTETFHDATSLSRSLEDIRVLSISRAFRIWFNVLLGVVILFQLFLFFSIIRYRKNTTMQLGQSSVLAVFVLVGAFCVGSCNLFMPINDTHCLLREPFIFTSLTLMGNILTGRIWRINLVMCPVLQLGKSANGNADHLKTKVMNALTLLSDYYILSDTAKCQGRRGVMKRRRMRSSIRQKIPIQQLLWLVFLMLIPQLVLQICNLTIPRMQSSQKLHAISSEVSQEVCRHSLALWPSWVGLALTMMPYILTFFLVMRSNHLPSVFNEADAVQVSFKVFLLVICITGPAFGMAVSPDVQAYLLTCVVFGLTMPPSWLIVAKKLCPLWMGTSSKLKVKHIFGHQSKKAGFAEGLSLDKNEEHGKSATLALTIGKMYEDMGMVQQSIALFEDALALWKWDLKRDDTELIGGYTVNEVNAFTAKDLEYIINLKIAQGRVNGTFNSSQNTGQKNAAQAWLDALEIYERSPASINMTDRSIIFPIFSGLFVFLKGDKIEQDAECNFEQNLARKFVRETKLHGDPVHYTRALAMQGEVKARLGKYEEALAAFEKLKAVYIQEEHSEAISSAYGTDRSAQAYSQSALWHMQLGNMAEALQTCNYVLDVLLPKMDPKNVLNSCEMLLPIIRILKNRGEEKRMRRLFDEHVQENFHRHFGKDGVTPCLPIFRPLLLLLDICNEAEECPDLVEGVKWLLEDEANGDMPDFLDSVYVKLCWSPNSMVAELCLRLAKKVTSESDKIALLMKGLKLARKADRKMKDEEGNVKLPIAYEIHEPVYTELKSMAEMYGVQLGDGTIPFGTQTSHIGPTNLPDSYLQHHTSDDHSTVSCGSDSTPNQGLRRVGSTHSLRSMRRSSGVLESLNEEDGD